FEICEEELKAEAPVASLTVLSCRHRSTMKRFFQPVPKEGSAKKLALSATAPPLDEAEGPGAAGPASAVSEGENREPLKFLTWNANSLLLRAKNDWPEFSKFVEDLDPDVICFQEVRMPAAGSKGATKNPSELKDDTSSAREEKQIPSMQGLLYLLNVNSSLKRSPFPLIRHHEPDGRVILAEFESFRLLNTYVPNNGWKDDESSFIRRRKWDKRVLDFVLLSSEKPLIWCGDLNVSHQDIDVSHPDFFISAKLNGYIPPNREV
ncbi:hypothetical protein Taro_029937, partial [Colocasia esculenta]|nr:hypothetical protein [Colocasia esculenta]